MFSDDILLKNKVLRKVWCAAHNQNVPETSEKTSILKICETLNKWVTCEDKDARRRMSLRTSATMIKGAAKLYNQELEQVLEDSAKLDNDIVHRNRRPSRSSGEDSSDSSEPCNTPENIMRQFNRQSDISAEIHKTPAALSTSPPLVNYSLSSISEDSVSHTTKRRSTESINDSVDQSPKRRITCSLEEVAEECSEEIFEQQSYRKRLSTISERTENISDISDTVARLPNYNDITYVCHATNRQSNDVRGGSEIDSQKSVILAPKTRKNTSHVARKKKSPNATKDQATQTGSSHPNMSDRDNGTFDESLPFGHLFIYDSYRSRFPSTVVFSSIRRDYIDKLQ